MQNVNGVCKFGDIKNTPFPQDVNPYFSCPRAHSVHRFPVRRIETILHCGQFKTSLSACFRRKVAQIVQAGANEL